ncbi:MAG: hypothetical protein K2Z81_05205 [Cyanobacteria bacterium]|nr:hypothetical protein [Cyanobacteriota bacterium]
MFRFSVHSKSVQTLLFASFLSASLSIPQSARAQQVVAGVQVFPTNNIWNKKIDTLPVDSKSDTYVNTIGRTTSFHPDWGSPAAYGIPFNVVKGTARKPLKFFNVTFDYADESDSGPYPVSKKLLIEGDTWASSNGGDRHVLMIDPATKTLYELYYTYANRNNYTAGSGAIFRLDQNTLRPNGWTSADAAGLPIFPALVNYDEAASGQIKHALRFTCSRTNGYIWPARHKAGPQTAGWPPMGQRFRLKSSFDISSYSAINKAILTALKQYGMFVADNGSNWYMTGTSDPRWNNDDLNALKKLKGSDFEAVNESTLMVNPDSGQSN